MISHPVPQVAGSSRGSVLQVLAMYLALAMLSSQALLLLADENSLIASRVWKKSESQEMGDLLSSEMDALLAEAKVSLSQIIALYCAQGPGSFSGLRISSAFFKGLSFALKIPLIGITTYDIYGETTSIPLRAQKAEQMTVEEYQKNLLKFLVINSDESHISDKAQGKLLGFSNEVEWPTVLEFYNGLQKSKSRKSFELDYGYTPEFVKLKN